MIVISSAALYFFSVDEVAAISDPVRRHASDDRRGGAWRQASGECRIAFTAALALIGFFGMLPPPAIVFCSKRNDVTFAELERLELLVGTSSADWSPLRRELLLGAPTVNFAPLIAVVDFDLDSTRGY